MTHTINLKPDTPRPSRFELEIDGLPVTEGITAATLESRGGDLPVLTVELVAVDVPGVEIGRGRVLIGGKSLELLMRAGWTPPPVTGEPALHGDGVFFRYPAPLSAVDADAPVPLAAAE